jgi:hypothetical protein
MVNNEAVMTRSLACVLLLGCGSPFSADALATDAAPDAPPGDGDASNADADARHDDAPPDAPAHDAAVEAAPEPEAGPDGSDASDAADAGCMLQVPDSFTCGANMAPITIPADFCRLEDQSSTGAPVATPGACQCAGQYVCACIVATLTPAELCPGGSFDACGAVSGHVVVRCLP